MMLRNVWILALSPCVRTRYSQTDRVCGLNLTTSAFNQSPTTDHLPVQFLRIEDLKLRSHCPTSTSLGSPSTCGHARCCGHQEYTPLIHRMYQEERKASPARGKCTATLSRGVAWVDSLLQSKLFWAAGFLFSHDAQECQDTRSFTLCSHTVISFMRCHTVTPFSYPTAHVMASGNEQQIGAESSLDPP